MSAIWKHWVVSTTVGNKLLRKNYNNFSPLHLKLRFRCQSLFGLQNFCCSMWMPLGIFGFHNPRCTHTPWSGVGIKSYYHWCPPSLWCNLKYNQLKLYLSFLLAVPNDCTTSVFRSRLNFLLSSSSPILIVPSKWDSNLPKNCLLAMCLSDSRQNLCENFQFLGEIVLYQLPIAKPEFFLMTYAWCKWWILQKKFWF